MKAMKSFKFVTINLPAWVAVSWMWWSASSVCQGQAPPAGPGPGEAPVSIEYFHTQLAPYGAWVMVDGVSYWRPDAVVKANPDWRPYYDMGQWVQTENGLFWQSEYTWGDIPFHYGRWVLRPGYGWLWAPDLEWGPAWVFWRHAEAEAAIGWAPLPVGAVVVEGGYLYNGVHFGLEFDFGIGETCFTFVDCAHFHEPFYRWHGHEYAWHVHGERFHSFYHHSVIRNEFHRGEHGFVNHGIGRERLERATRGRIEHSHFEERNPVADRSKYNGPRTVASTGGAGGHPGGTVAHPGGAAGGGVAGHPGVAGGGGHPGGGAGTGLSHNTGAGGGSGSHNMGGGGASTGASKVFRPPTATHSAPTHSVAQATGTRKR